MLAMSATLVAVFGTPQVLKGAVADSGAYNTFVDSGLDSALKEQDKNTQDIPLDRQEVKAAVQSAFPPSFLQSNTEQVIESVYAWLQAKTPEPNFHIDLTGAKQNLINSLADYAAKRTTSLPACTIQQLRDLQGRDIDPFSVSCLPPGLSADSVRQKVVSDLSGDKDFLKDTVITEATLPKNEKGQTLFEQARQAPDIYNKATRAPTVFAALALFAAAGVIFLHEERRRGIRSVGYSFISVGVIVFVSTWLVGFGMDRLKSPGGPLAKVSDNTFQYSLLDIVTRVTHALNSRLYTFCAAYVILGIVMFIALKVAAQGQLQSTIPGGMAEAPVSGPSPRPGLKETKK